MKPSAKLLQTFAIDYGKSAIVRRILGVAAAEGKIRVAPHIRELCLEFYVAGATRAMEETATTPENTNARIQAR